MTNDKKLKFKIREPITEEDYLSVHELVGENILFDSNLDVQYFKKCSSGELLIAIYRDEVIGMLRQRRPGRIFSEIPKNHFDLDKYKFPKASIGYISLTAVKKKYQKKGVGRALVIEALKYQKLFGSAAVAVHCWQSSPGNASQKMFESFGFLPIKIHISPWLAYSKKAGIKKFRCVVCGNPCKCDELEMVKYL